MKHCEALFSIRVKVYMIQLKIHVWDSDCVDLPLQPATYSFRKNRNGCLGSLCFQTELHLPLTNQMLSISIAISSSALKQGGIEPPFVCMPRSGLSNHNTPLHQCRGVGRASKTRMQILQTRVKSNSLLDISHLKGKTKEEKSRH